MHDKKNMERWEALINKAHKNLPLFSKALTCVNKSFQKQEVLACLA